MNQISYHATEVVELSLFNTYSKSLYENDQFRNLTQAFREQVGREGNREQAYLLYETKEKTDVQTMVGGLWLTNHSV